MKEEHKKKKRIGKIIAITCAIVIGIPVLTALSYVGYVVFSYHRVGNTTLDIKKDAKKEKVQVGQELSLTTYNIGFGSYSPDYTFFMDLGYDENGVATAGVHGKGISKEDVQTNIDGSINIVKELVSDFYALQEVDVDSDRAYHINQKEAFEKEMTDYDNTFAINFDSAYLFYPLNDPHGKSKAGLSTYSKYSISESERKEYTISTGFSKFFDLDRCFSVKQIDELYSFMKSEYDKGNYVIAGGDFNHDLLTNNPLYPQYTKENFAYKDMVKQPMPDWLNFMFDDNKTCKFDDGFTVYAANNEPSCRDCDVAWQRGYTYVSTVDGFIVSENITVNSVETKKVGDNGFAYSDHQPSTLKFNF